MIESRNRQRIIEQAMLNLRVKAFVANGGQIKVEPIRPATKDNPMALSVNTNGRPRNRKRG